MGAAVKTDVNTGGKRADIGAVFALAVREALVAAVLAVLLAVPFLGLKADNTGSALGLTTRWPLAGVAVGLVFAGRLALVLGREVLRHRHRRRAEDSGNDEDTGAGGGRTGRIMEAIQDRIHWVGTIGIAFALTLPLLPFSDRYVVDTATTLLIYVMLGWGLNIVVGLAGLLDLGYVAFYAVGAYTYALLSITFDLSFWICLPLSGMVAATFGLLLGFPVLRLRGDYLAIVTLGFGEIIRVILVNWSELTNGSQGLAGIPRPTFFGLPFSAAADAGPTVHSVFGLAYDPLHRVVFLYYLILALALVTNLFTLRIRRLPIGRAWEALREDETACVSLGINPTNTKLSAFAIGAMFAGFAGSFFATRQGFISPESFTFIESAIIVAIVVLGGMGSQTGVVIAAFVLVVVPELFRDFAEYRMLLFGLAMVAIMVWRPRGLLARRDPTLRLRPAGSARGAQ